MHIRHVLHYHVYHEPLSHMSLEHVRTRELQAEVKHKINDTNKFKSLLEEVHVDLQVM